MGALSGAKRVGKGTLDMSRKARMARAKAQGYGDDVWYHGTPDSRGINEGFKSKPSNEDAFFFSRGKRTANSYADDSRAFDYQNSEPETLSLLVNPGRQKQVDWGGKAFRGEDFVGDPAVRQEVERLEAVTAKKKQAWLNSNSKTEDTKRAAYLEAKQAKDDFSAATGNEGMYKKYYLHDDLDRYRDEGYDSVLVNNIRDTYKAGGSPDDILVKFDNKGIRRKEAEFNPEKTGSPNLLAGLSGAAVGAGALAGAGASQDAEAGFFGPASKLWNKSAEAAAKKMLRAGASRDSIWRETGIDLGNVDGIPRAEFDDSSFDILTENLGWGDRVPRGSMSESISGTPILEHYPDIGDIRAAQVGPGESVFYRPGGAGPFDREKIDYGGRKSAAHELQHAIQGREGMTSGASGQNMNYRRNAGEVEARNVEDRIGMSPQERIDAPPWLTEDTPTREQLVPGGRSRRKLAIAEGAAPAAGLGGMLLGEQAQAAAYSENPYATPKPTLGYNQARAGVLAGAAKESISTAAMLLNGLGWGAELGGRIGDDRYPNVFRRGAGRLEGINDRITELEEEAGIHPYVSRLGGLFGI